MSFLTNSRDHTCQLETEFKRVEGTGARIEKLLNGSSLEGAFIYNNIDMKQAYLGPLRIFKGTLPYPG